jgi:DNA-binding transcriptional MerR regulator
MQYTIGELAKLSGLTVRALHHYEQLGLLAPSGRTDAGYRLYTEADVPVLHRILAYQQMGLPLKQIGPLLGADAPPLDALIARQIVQMEAQLERQQRLLAMTRRVAARAREGGPARADELLALMSMMRTYERHFTPEELQRLVDLQARLGPDGIARLKAELAELLPAIRAAMERRADPRGDEVRALALRWIALGAVIPEAEALRDKGRAMLAAEPGVQRAAGVTPALVDYIDQAVEAAKEDAR